MLLDSAQRGGSSVALLEITGGKGSIQVNGRTHRKNTRLILSGGDEVVFGSSGKHAYVSFTYGSIRRIYLFSIYFLLLLPSFIACLCDHLHCTRISVSHVMCSAYSLLSCCFFPFLNFFCLCIMCP